MKNDMKGINIIRDIIIAVLLVLVAGWLFVFISNQGENVQEKQEEQEKSQEIIQNNFTTGISGQVTMEVEFFDGVVDILADDPEREVIARIRTDEKGIFVATVPAGSYVLVAQTNPLKLFPVCQEVRAKVQKEEIVVVKIKCDSGIR